MVEQHVLPVRRAVARFAGGPERALVRVLGAMTGGAGLALVAFVNIILLMAADARLWGIAKFSREQVACDARGFDVAAGQRKFGERMVECFAVKAQDIAGPPLVLCVAMLATADDNFRPFAVKAMMGRDIGRNRLVAAEAEVVLGLFGESLVAIAAIGLELGMGVRELAGHHQLLKDGGGRRRRRDAKKAHQCRQKRNPSPPQSHVRSSQ